MSERISRVRVEPERGNVPPFVPGQYIRLGLRAPAPAPALVKRSYSIVSSANERAYYELFVVHVEDGTLTTRLFEHEPEGRIWMDERARGFFTLEGVPAGRDLVMLATGTGVGPYISMLRTYHGTKRWRRFVLAHGVRRIGDLGYRDEVEAIVRSDPTVSYVPLASREDATFDGRRGHVTDLLDPSAFAEIAGVALSPESVHLFLCGNPAMIRDGRARAEALGFTIHGLRRPGNLHFERYW